jgi:hypothetical protein
VYEIAAKPKSDVYRDVLPLLNSGRVELLDHPRLLAQFAALDRRTARDRVPPNPVRTQRLAPVKSYTSGVMESRDE